MPGEVARPRGRTPCASVGVTFLELQIYLGRVSGHVGLGGDNVFLEDFFFQDKPQALGPLHSWGRPRSSSCHLGSEPVGDASNLTFLRFIFTGKLGRSAVH